MPKALQRSFDELTRLSALEKAAVRGNLAAHLRRLRALAAALPEGSPPTAMAGGLAAALQVDLAFLCVRPAALASTLLWRCSPHEREPGPLAALVQRWREEELLREPATIEEIRALTPLPHGPGGPLIAELPAAVPHQLLSMTREGHVLLQLSPRTPEAAFRHWIVERGTLVEAPEARIPAPPLKFVFEPWEGAALHHAASGAHHCDLAIPEGGDASEGAFSPDGTLCAVAGSGDEYSFGFVHLYETATGRTLREWGGPRVFWSRPVFSPDGRRVMAMSESGLFLWSITGEQEECLPVHDAKGAAFSLDGRTVVTTNGNAIRVWDLERLRALGPIPASPPKPMAFSPDGRRLVLGDWLRDGATGRRLRDLEIERGRYLVGGPPKRWFFCGSERLISLEGGEHVWASEDGRGLAERRARHHWHRTATAFSADGRRYAVGQQGDSTAEVLDADTGAVLATVEAAVASGLSCLALSPDGRWLAGGTEGGEVEVWSAVDGRHVCTLRGHERPVSDMAFSLDGRHLASAGDDEALRLWEIPRGRAVAVRPLDDRDLTYTSYTPGGGSTTHRSWSATPDAVTALSGWEGFAGPPPGPLSVQVDGAVTTFTHRATGRIAAVLPIEGPWLMHPAGRSWVSPSAHVTFELPRPS